MGELFYSLGLESLTITQNKKQYKINRILSPKSKTLLHGKKQEANDKQGEYICTLHRREKVSLPKVQKLLRKNRTCSEKNGQKT